MNGVIIVNKSEGITSQQVVNTIKHKFPRGTKVGHYGTLDPNATGVLPVAIGKATKLFDLMLNKVKVYRAIFRFGQETSTLDSEGEVIQTSTNIPTEKQVIEAIKNFIGDNMQVPPQYSAKSVNGVRAYELARKNIVVELKPKQVKILRFEYLEQIDDKSFLFEIECSSGTYIRSICRDLAYSLDSVAYMPVLIRLRAGMFDIQNSIDYNAIKEKQDLSSYVIPIKDVIDLSIIKLTSEEMKKFGNGMTLIFESENGKYKVFYEDMLLGIGNVISNKLKMEIKLYD